MKATDGQLLIDDEVVAEWTYKDLQGCKIALTFNDKDVNSGDVLNDAGKLTLTVTNKY